jgi:hypothetical protein
MSAPLAADPPRGAPVSTRCNGQLTFDIPPYSAVAAKCARALSANGAQMIVAIAALTATA